MTTKEVSSPPSSRLAILSSHPIQYYAPLFRTLSTRVDLEVFYAFQPTPGQLGEPGFGQAISWDIDLLSGYRHTFLDNISLKPGSDTFNGCDTPEIYQQLKNGGFTHLLVIGWHLKTMIQGIIAARRIGLKVLVRGDSHLMTPRSVLKRIIKAVTYPLLLRVFDAALYVGERNREYYTHYAYPGERLFFSPHAVEYDRFAGSSGIDIRQIFRAAHGLDDKFVVAYVGKLLKIKSPEHIVRAVAELRERGVDAVVLLAGAGVEEAAVKRRAVEMSVPVCFLGFVSQMELPSVYASADVLLLASESETWGLVCNEALATGTPVVVSDLVGCAPDLADGTVGRVFRHGDIIDAANQLDWIRQNYPSVESLGRVNEKYSFESAARGVLNAILATTKEAN